MEETDTTTLEQRIASMLSALAQNFPAYHFEICFFTVESNRTYKPGLMLQSESAEIRMRVNRRAVFVDITIDPLNALDFKLAVTKSGDVVERMAINSLTAHLFSTLQPFV